MVGTVTDTYVAALQHGIADLPDGAAIVGVVRRATPWFHAQVEENRPALGPPEALLAEVKERHEALVADGIADAEGHNAAMDDVNYDERYLEHLDTSPDAKAALADLRDRVASGEDVALVCYENTDEKRCHRTLLRDRLKQELSG